MQIDYFEEYEIVSDQRHSSEDEEEEMEVGEVQGREPQDESRGEMDELRQQFNERVHSTMNEMGQSSAQIILNQMQIQNMLLMRTTIDGQQSSSLCCIPVVACT